MTKQLRYDNNDDNITRGDNENYVNDINVNNSSNNVVVDN